ncbi:hypothetical protein [Thermoleptolyngbya sp. C42_A2020_037]|uniref:hypothetical protein n=1 Tax=Thermoleptolyngbya sp. C42_A2020_037 TaxID=2747799 RepID=UPI0025E1787A|nr:hypothetical protein [Thermoleptolyngbya sp. C42_A2020_037]
MSKVFSHVSQPMLGIEPGILIANIEVAPGLEVAAVITKSSAKPTPWSKPPT